MHSGLTRDANSISLLSVNYEVQQAKVSSFLACPMLLVHILILVFNLASYCARSHCNWNAEWESAFDHF